jgi:hypothetical protein
LLLLGTGSPCHVVAEQPTSPYFESTPECRTELPVPYGRLTAMERKVSPKLAEVYGVIKTGIIAACTMAD